MTQEEKAKAYDEAFRIAQELYNNPNSSNIGKGYVCTVFPELKESDDERIRKWLICYFKDVCDNVSEKEKKGVLVWLDKQGEQRPSMEGVFVNVDEVRDDFMQEVYRILDADRTNDRANQIIDAFDHLPTVIIEKQGEQKHADKVKPKFHEGEWITNGDYTWKIVEVKPLDYILQSQDGNRVDDTISHVDEQFHSFTIKDAKDGDVLAKVIYPFGPSICIFKEFIQQNFTMKVYCLINDKGQFHLSHDSYYHRYDVTLYPATKEQRDTLMKAMADAGYTFDFDKKELKKIEQKPVKEHDVCNNCDEKASCVIPCPIKLIEQKPAWSKEDEKEVAILEAYIRSKDLSEKHIDRALGIIDELVNKVKSQKQWKPTEEQIAAIEYIIRSYESTTIHLYDGVAKQLYKLLEQLKQL